MFLVIHAMQTGNDLQQFNRVPCLGLVIASQSLQVGHALVVHELAKFQCLSVKCTFQGLTLPGEFLSLLVRSRHTLKFQALKFQTLGFEIWLIRPPPFRSPRFACLDSMYKLCKHCYAKLQHNIYVGNLHTVQIANQNRETNFCMACLF